MIMPDKHAFLSPSSAERWYHCPPSAWLCEQYPDLGSVFAAEGTEAHSLCEFLLGTALERPGLMDPRPGMQYYTEEMEECCQGYVSYVLENVERMRLKAAGGSPAVYVEQRVDLRRFIPESMGTSDCVIVGPDEIVIVDFKYGMYPVPATSLQLRIYALGACELFSSLYDFASVRMAVFQPRLSSVDEMSLGVEELYSWARSELAPRARLAFDGAGEFAPGEWCRMCRARRSCRALAEYQMEMDRYGRSDPALLSDTEIADVLSRVDELISWANGVREYALEQAMQGREFPGYVLSQGRSYRRFTDEDAVVSRLEAAGLDPWEPRKVCGITALEKRLGKKKFASLLSDLVSRPAGRPVLVPGNGDRERAGGLDFVDAVYAEIEQ